MSPLLQAASIAVRAGTHVVLDDMSLSFDQGETVALIGPNGAGKSTLLRVLSGDLRPQSGHVHLQGRALASYPPHVLAMHRAVLSQRVNIAFPFTVAEVVRMGANHGHDSRIEALIDATLAELDLHAIADRVVTTLSGGEQQRVHFARVLVQLAYGQGHGGCGILLLDEPTASLDLRHQVGMLDAISRRARHGALAVVVFHDLNLAARFARRVVVLDHGRIDCQGRPDEIITGQMLKRVFGIETTVFQAPASGAPYVLPQTMTAAESLDIEA